MTMHSITTKNGRAEHIAVAENELAKNAKHFKERRITRQARVDSMILEILKIKAKEDGLTISKLIDRLCSIALGLELKELQKRVDEKKSKISQQIKDLWPKNG